MRGGEAQARGVGDTPVDRHTARQTGWAPAHWSAVAPAAWPPAARHRQSRQPPTPSAAVADRAPPGAQVKALARPVCLPHGETGGCASGGGAPTAGISHVARPFSAMQALARHDATPAASSSTAGEAGHSVQSRGTSHCADWQSLFQPGGLSAFALTRLPSYCCIDAHLGDRSPLRGGWRDVLPFKGCSG